MRVDYVCYAYTLLRFETVYSGSATSHKVSQLDPTVTYRLRVRAENDVGASDYCSPQSFQTTELPPQPHKGIVAVLPAISSFSISLFFFFSTSCFLMACWFSFPLSFTSIPALYGAPLWLPIGQVFYYYFFGNLVHAGAGCYL